MSVNHFQSDLPATFVWLQHHPTMENQPYSQQFNPQIYTHQNQPWLLSNFNLNRENNVEDGENDELTRTEDGEEGSAAASRDDWEETGDKLSMFEKALTPSDVGKLNRLVIPKQHAEKYFPLEDGGDSGDKGLLLSFEDEAGKSWRFRYSYWNSSQSYVLTKGWSRYVKEKRLASGDVVFFQRHRTNGERLFIGCRRRPAQRSRGTVMGQEDNGLSNQGSGGWTRLFYSAHPYPEHGYYPDHQHRLHHYHPAPHQPDCLHTGSFSGQSPKASVGNSKILRLFGVNMECQTDIPDDPTTPFPSLLTKSATPNHQFFPQYFSSNPANHTTDVLLRKYIKRETLTVRHLACHLLHHN